MRKNDDAPAAAGLAEHIEGAAQPDRADRRTRRVQRDGTVASNTAAAMAKTPGSPDETTTTFRPSAASLSASQARFSSMRLSEG